MTLLEGAFASLFPPMKWSASLNFAAYEVEPFKMGTVPFALALPALLTAAIVYVKTKLAEDEQKEEEEEGLPIVVLQRSLKRGGRLLGGE